MEIFKTNEVAWSGATPTIASLLVLAGPLRTLSIHYGVFKKCVSVVFVLTQSNSDILLSLFFCVSAGVAAWTMTGSLALAIVMVRVFSLK